MKYSPISKATPVPIISTAAPILIFSFISTNYPIVPGTLIGFFTPHCQAVKLRLVPTVAFTLYCQSSTDFIGFHTLWPKTNLVTYCSSLVCTWNAAVLSMSQH
jgi:hypothetical protein